MISKKAKIAIIDECQAEVSLFINLIQRKKLCADINVYFTAQDFFQSLFKNTEEVVPDILICSSELRDMSGYRLISLLQNQPCCNNITYIINFSTYPDISYGRTNNIFYTPRPMTITALNRVIDSSDRLLLVNTENGTELLCRHQENPGLYLM